jgi:hypothetical protein
MVRPIKIASFTFLRMSKEDKEWEEILGKYQNEHESTERYLPVPNSNGAFLHFCHSCVDHQTGM